MSMIDCRIGRKVPLMIAVVLQSILGILSTLMPNYTLFLVFTILSSIATGGTMLISFVISMLILNSNYFSYIFFFFFLAYINS